MKRVTWLWASFSGLVLGLGLVFYAGTILSSPVPRVIGTPPPDLGAVDVRHRHLRGWFVQGVQGAPCVVLMHGVRADRRSMISRARFLREAGYSSLLFDFQAHGESAGQHITFGHLESADARAAVAVLRSKFRCERVAAIGQSLGGAAALLGPSPLEVDALVVESVYPTLEEAVADRLKIRFGEAGTLLGPLLTLQLEPRLGVDVKALRPINGMAKFPRPVLVIAGTEDRHTTFAESRRLFDAAQGPKEFWAVPGAAHVDMHDFSPLSYRRRILDFFRKYLGSPAVPASA